jgi:hypothetical protein
MGLEALPAAAAPAATEAHGFSLSPQRKYLPPPGGDAIGNGTNQRTTGRPRNFWPKPRFGSAGRRRKPSMSGPPSTKSLLPSFSPASGFRVNTSSKCFGSALHFIVGDVEAEVEKLPDVSSPRVTIAAAINKANAKIRGFMADDSGMFSRKNRPGTRRICSTTPRAFAPRPRFVRQRGSSRSRRASGFGAAILWRPSL